MALRSSAVLSLVVTRAPEDRSTEYIELTGNAAPERRAGLCLQAHAFPHANHARPLLAISTKLAGLEKEIHAAKGQF